MEIYAFVKIDEKIYTIFNFIPLLHHESLVI